MHVLLLGGTRVLGGVPRGARGSVPIHSVRLRNDRRV